jgi:hypothetical protein
MAISPLALGIGLQGKYDYKTQAALEMSRAKGRAKAEADADAAKAKKRAPYERALMKVDTSGLLPYQAKLIKEKYADALQSFEENPDDYSQHAASMQDINSSSKAFRDQAENYKRLSIQQGGMPADVQALKVIGTLSDRDQINQELGKLGPATSIAFANDQFVFDNPKYTGTGESIAKSINSMQFELLEGAPVITVGDKKFAGVDINKNVPALITANIMSDANRKKSAINDYLQFSIDNDIPYDFSTPESTNEFLNNTTAWVQKKAQTDVDTRSKELNVTPSKGVNVSYNVGSKLGGVPVNFTQQSDIYVGPGKQVFRSFGGLPVQSDVKLTLPNDGETYNVKSGKRMDRADVVEGTYNRVGLGYIAKEDYNFPTTKVKLQNGSTITLPAKYFKKGEPLLSQYALQMAYKGKAKAGFVVFGEGKTNDGSPIELMRNYADMGVSRFLDATKYERADLNQLDQNAVADRDRLQAKIDSYNQSNAPAPTPTPTPAPKIDIPKQQGDVKKATTPNKAATKTTTKQPAAPKGTSTSTRRTPEADAAKEALRIKLQGK